MVKQKNKNSTRWWLPYWLFTRFCLFWKNYRLIAADLSKQALDADPKAIPQIDFTGKIDNIIRIHYVLQQSKETILEFAKGTK